MSFEKKKIQMEILSEYLRQVREVLGLSQEDVAEQTGIKLKFVQSLEDGEFKHLPPDVYVLGFLRQLAEAYSIEGNTLVSQFKKEKAIHNQMDQRLQTGRPWAKKFLSRFVITPKFLSIVLGGIFVLVTLVYIIWQVASINKIPSLEIFEPQDRQIVKGSLVSVRGKTDPGMGVTVNGQDVYVDNDGNFKIQLSVEAGPKELDVTATNKFDKTATEKISIVGENLGQATTSPVTLKLDFTDTVSLRFSIDEGPQQSLDFYKGDTKVLNGQKKIVLSTSNAGATSASLNGQPLGFLGRLGESLNNIPFFAETGPK